MTMLLLWLWLVASIRYEGSVADCGQLFNLALGGVVVEGM